MTSNFFVFTDFIQRNVFGIQKRRFVLLNTTQKQQQSYLSQGHTSVCLCAVHTHTHAIHWKEEHFWCSVCSANLRAWLLGSFQVHSGDELRIDK